MPTSATSKKKRNSRAIGQTRAGFTLLELTVVVAILSILFGLVFFGLDGVTESQRLASSARRLCAFIKDVRNRAICGQERLYIIYMPVENEVHLCSSLKQLDEESNRTEKFRLEEGVKISKIAMGKEDMPTGRKTVIEVSSLGDLQEHRIVLANQSETVTVRVDGLLGIASIEE